MNQNFDVDRFIRRIGERLVDEFKDAKAGTTPSTVGTAAEQPVRDQLEQVLPSPHFSVRRGKALFLSGCESHPATVAPAGSSRSGS